MTKAHDGRPVLRGINLQVGAGEVLGLVGENAVGKSTLMSVIAGDYSADSGLMTLSGEPYSATSRTEARDKGVGIIRQKIEIDPELTVAQAIFRESAWAGESIERLTRQAEYLLRDVGIDLDPRAKMSTLLRSEHGMVEAARMLAEDARIVIMDEVAATFNVHEIADLHFITSRLTRQGRSVIYISHRLHEVIEVSDRIVVLVDGHVEREVPSAEATTDLLADVMFKGRQRRRSSREGHLTSDVLLEVRGLATPDLLSDVSFEIHRGEILGLAGPRRNGMVEVAGALIGEVEATWDLLRMAGQDRIISTPADAASLRIAYFSDDNDELGLSPSETIARSLMSGGWEDEQDFKSEVAALREIIESIQKLRIKAASLRSSVGTMSGGDQQKIALTRWMTEDRDLLVLNEPTRGLDVAARQDVHSLLADHTAAGRAVILISSDPNELKAWCDRVILMKEGRITGIHDTATLDAEQISRAMIGNLNAA